MQLEGKSGLSITEACQVAGLSRAGFYRHFDEHAPRQADTELRELIQRICLESRCYGSRRVVGELRKRGRIVNRKKVIRLMQADNLLCLHSSLGYIAPTAYGAITYQHAVEKTA
jgi:putative transposase